MIVRRLRQIGKITNQCRLFASSGHHEEHDHGHQSHEIDPAYWYNKYGLFHRYTWLNQSRPIDKHNTDEEDPYRNEIQGYIQAEDPSDTRGNQLRGIYQFIFLAFGVFLVGILGHRRFVDNNRSFKMGDALVVAQELEDTIKRLQKDE